MTERDSERGEGRDPIDEEAAWAEIVAGYGEEPADPPGVWPRADQIDLTDTVDRATPAREVTERPGDDRSDVDEVTDVNDINDLTGRDDAGGTLLDPGDRHTVDGTGGLGEAFGHDQDHDRDRAQGQGQGGAGDGPRDWEAAEDEDEGHFVPPEPPPLPETDLTTKLAWFAVIGGPLLLFGVVLLQFPMTWWLATLGIGGFLGGFATLVSRMRDDEDDEWPDPGSGAVV